MGDTLFMQFYSRRSSGIYNLLNGFSDAYDLCRQHGDFYWMQDEPDASRWYDYDNYAAKALPLAKGTIYVSALDVNHLYQCWVWAKEHPDINFVIGGPVATEKRIGSQTWDPAYVRVEDVQALPPNLTVTGKSVEAWFGAPDFSGPWQLDFPEEIPADSRVYFSYTLDNTCFWSRCIYCNIGLHDTRKVRRRQKMDFEFKNLDFEGVKLVRLNTGSITTRQLKALIPNMPAGNGFEYRTFMRAAAPETQALAEAVAACKGPVPKIVLGFGLEFPTRRMLRHVDKGFQPQEIIDALAVCDANGVRANGNVIVGWDNLTEGDIGELEDFMQQIPKGAFVTMQLRWLFAHPYTPIHDHYDGQHVRFGPFYEGFRVRLDDVRQIDLNRRAIDIFERCASSKAYRLEGLDNARQSLQLSKDRLNTRPDKVASST